MKHLTTFFIVVLIASAGFLGNGLYQTKIELNQTVTELLSTQNNLSQKESEILNLNSNIKDLKSQIVGYQFEIADKEREIKESENKIEELTEVTKSQEESISRLRDVLSDLDKTGNLISENYGETLILYDNSKIFELFRPLWKQVEDDEEDYTKLGIAFIYFRDESKKYEENVVLGQYNGLFDTIFIYSDTTNVKTIYHEIAHTIYKVLFQNNQNNKKIWSDLYKQLKENQLLSSQYAYTSEEEGFAEEYAYYKTGLNPNQPSAVKNMMEQIDESLR
ncbi:MAG: hypothetical protein Q8R00_01640 [Candidatus Nanoarchaeia archaeon]|nr:hypothetical protein [Candidatus Nanoarchaeia archaeon]